MEIQRYFKFQPSRLVVAALAACLALPQWSQADECCPPKRLDRCSSFALGAVGAVGIGAIGFALGYDTNSRRGPRGARGPQGPEGPQGLNGQNGLNGKDGENGINGMNGDNGNNGMNGGNGMNGMNGGNGMNGMNGQNGQNGQNGPGGGAGQLVNQVLNLFFVNDILAGNDLRVSWSLQFPDGTIEDDGGTPIGPPPTPPSGILFTNPAPNLTGVYTLTLTVDVPTGISTPIGTFSLNGTDFVLQTGKDPEVSDTWANGDTIILTASL